MADQRFFYLLLAADRMLQIVGSKLVVVDTDILIVNTGAVEMGDRLSFQLIKTMKPHANVALRAGAQIALQRLAHRLPGVKARLVKAVQIQFKAFDSIKLTLV